MINVGAIHELPLQMICILEKTRYTVVKVST